MNHIGLFTPGWPGQNTPNGVATSVYFLALGLQQIGVTPVIITKNIDGTCPDGIPVVVLEDLPWRLQDRLGAKLGRSDATNRHVARTIASAVQQAHKTYGLDALIMEETNGWAGLVQGLLPQLPVVITLHGPSVVFRTAYTEPPTQASRQREDAEGRAFVSVAGLIAPSQNVLEGVEKAVPLADVPRRVIANSYTSDAFDLAAPLPSGHDILFVGRFDRHKGGDTVIEAFARLLETHPQARLTFVGPDRGVRRADGSMRYLKEELSALTDKVRAQLDYKGPLGRDEIIELRRTHATALIASRYENLNYSLLEAMAAGQAIVCTAVGGPADVLEDGQTALMVPPEDADAMAAALGKLIDDPALKAHLGQTTRSRLAQDFSPAAIARQTMTFVQHVKTHAS